MASLFSSFVDGLHWQYCSRTTLLNTREQTMKWNATTYLLFRNVFPMLRPFAVFVINTDICHKKTPWPESASDRHLSTKLALTVGDRGCHVVSPTNPYGCNLDFLDRSRYFLF
jgi:hypothetical protein